MMCALIVTSGLALFLAGVITGAVLVFMAELDPPTKTETETDEQYRFD